MNSYRVTGKLSSVLLVTKIIVTYLVYDIVEQVIMVVNPDFHLRVI